jgi:hypothetical protein
MILRPVFLVGEKLRINQNLAKPIPQIKSKFACYETDHDFTCPE